MKNVVHKKKWSSRLQHWLLILGIIFLAGLIGIEVFLRWHYGLCDAVLMREDPDYEYIAQPNQKRHRLGNCIQYNSLSMRSEELRPNIFRLLILGDSVINGGTFTDQNDLATAKLSKKLSDTFHTDIQVMNVSAGSWGPDNCAAWVKKHGLFDAKAIILVVSSHDVHDTMTFAPVVGVLKYYPEKQYPLAILELLDRYLYPNWRTPHVEKAKADETFRKEHHIETTEIPFNPGFQVLYDLSKEHGVPFLIYLHSTHSEIVANEYDKDGKAIIDFCIRHQIECIQDLEHGVTLEDLYPNDYIHCSRKGQEFIAKHLYPFCSKIFIECKK